MRFDVGELRSAYPLVLDPDIVFSTYIGATQPNWGFTAAYDDDGRAMGGTALWSNDVSSIGTYPTTAGAISTAMTFGDVPVRLRTFGVQSGRHRPRIQHRVWRRPTSTCPRAS